MSVSYILFDLLALWAVILGAALGLLYEFFRLLHLLHPRVSWLIFLEDLLFCMLCTFGLLLLFFNLSYGRMRMYAFVFTAAGFVLWYFTAGKLFRKAVLLLVSLIRPRFAYVAAWSYTHIQTARFSHRAKNGFGSITFIRRKKDA